LRFKYPHLLHRASVAWPCRLLLITSIAVLPSVSSAADRPTEADLKSGVPVAVSVPGNAAPPKAELVLDLTKARLLALESHPGLKAARESLGSHLGLVFQAGRRLNPELSFGVENFGGNGSIEGLGVVQSTVGVVQTIRTAGKREKLIGAARAQQALSRWDLEATRRDLLRDVDLAFYGVLQAEKSLAIAENLVELAGRFHDSVGERVKEGQTSPVEVVRARILLSQQEVELRRRSADLKAARRVLSASLGGVLEIGPIRGELGLDEDLHSLEFLLDGIHGNPDIARWQDEIRALQADLAVARTGGVPDFELGGAYRRGHRVGEEAYVVEVSVPLPVNDRNRGETRSLERRLQVASNQRDQALLETRRDLEVAYRDQEAFRAQASILKEEIVPGSSRAFESIQEGYRMGMFGLLDVLDAQRTLFSSKANLVDALGGYHRARITVERLTRIEDSKDPPKDRESLDPSRPASPSANASQAPEIFREPEVDRAPPRHGQAWPQVPARNTR